MALLLAPSAAGAYKAKEEPWIREIAGHPPEMPPPAGEEAEVKTDMDLPTLDRLLVGSLETGRAHLARV
jgi:hypothetical protein